MHNLRLKKPHDGIAQLELRLRLPLQGVCLGPAVRAETAPQPLPLILVLAKSKRLQMGTELTPLS